MKVTGFLVAVITALILPFTVICESLYQIGVGIADVTGPAAEIAMVSDNYLFIESLYK